jgi:3-oxoacyl-[acyl-carrier-protein] synthase-3
MRYHDITITGIGTHLGQHVRTPPLVRNGLLSEADARTTRQRGVCVATQPGPDLAVAAARNAIRAHQAITGAPPRIGLHLHAAMHPNPDGWATASYVLNQLGIPDSGMAVDLGGTANGGVLAIDIAASILAARPDASSALISCGDRFGNNQFHRYSADHDVLFGDSGAALILSHAPEASGVSSIAELVATTSYTDPSLDGFTHGLPPVTAAADRAAEPVDIRARKKAWLDTNGGMQELLRRTTIGVTRTTNAVLADAGLDLGDVSWVLCPLIGTDAVDAHWLRPLDVSPNRTLSQLGLDIGHLGAADQIVGLHHLLATHQANCLSRGDHVLLVSSGAGMTWSAAVLHITAELGDR